MEGPCVLRFFPKSDTLPGIWQAWTKYPLTGYDDNVRCVMTMCVPWKIQDHPFFDTEAYRDVLIINGSKHSGRGGGPPLGLSGEAGVVFEWQSDNKITAGGWQINFMRRDPLPPAPPPEPSGPPRVVSGQCHFSYDPDKGFGFISSWAYPNGIFQGKDCVVVVPQGWYITSSKLSASAGQDFLNVSNQAFTGLDGPPVGLQLSGLLLWTVAGPTKYKDECVNNSPFYCGFMLQLRAGTEHLSRTLPRTILSGRSLGEQA